MSGLSLPNPTTGEILPDERILYFIRGNVRDGKVNAVITDRDSLRNKERNETQAYCIIRETPKRYTVVAVNIDEDNRVTYARGELAQYDGAGFANKSEMKCIRTPGFIQSPGQPVMGMFTFHKWDVATVHDAMTHTIQKDINDAKEMISKWEAVVDPNS